jgi:hypothetical protein
MMNKTITTSDGVVLCYDPLSGKYYPVEQPKVQLSIDQSYVEWKESENAVPGASITDTKTIASILIKAFTGVSWNRTIKEVLQTHILNGQEYRLVPSALIKTNLQVCVDETKVDSEPAADVIKHLVKFGKLDDLIQEWENCTATALRMYQALANPSIAFHLLSVIYRDSIPLVADPYGYGIDGADDSMTTPFGMFSLGYMRADIESSVDMSNGLKELKSNPRLVPYSRYDLITDDKVKEMRDLGILYTSLLYSEMDDWLKTHTEALAVVTPVYTPEDIHESDLVMCRNMQDFKSGSANSLMLGIETLCRRIRGSRLWLLPPILELCKFNSLHSAGKAKGKHYVSFRNYKWMLTPLIYALLVGLSYARVVLDGNEINNLADYGDIYGKPLAVPGPYLVAFSGNLYIKRYCDGNNSKAIPAGDPNNTVFPWLCPSPDWDSPCLDETCSGCSECQGKVFGNSCQYYHAGDHTKRSFAWVIPPYDKPGVILSDNDAYFEGYERFNETVVERRRHPEHHHIPLYDFNPEPRFPTVKVVLLSIACTVCALQLGLDVYIVVLTVLLHQKYKAVTNFDEDESDDPLDNMPSEETDESGIPMITRTSAKRNDANADTPTKLSKTQRLAVKIDMIKSKWDPIKLAKPKLAFISNTLTVVVVFSLLFGSAYAISYDMYNLQEIPDRVTYTNYSIPSVCSCSSPDSYESQLRCITPCNYNMTIGDTEMRMHFGFDITCTDMKLVVIDKIVEKRCHFCYGGDSEDSCYDSYRSNCDDYTCWYSVSEHGAWQNDCFLRGGNVHRVDVSYSIYDAKRCIVSSRSNNYIENYPSSSYVVSVSGTLLAQSSYVEVFIGGKWQTYKEINGGIGSDRAFLTPLENIASNGKLRPNSYQLQRMFLMRQWPDDADAGWDKHEIALPSFNPIVFDQTCQADITFSKLKCFSLPEVCTGTFVLNDGKTYFKATEKGICNGKIVSDEEYTALPNGLDLCHNCTVSTVCSRPYEWDGSCNLTVFEDELGNESSVAPLDWYTWDGLTSTMEGIAILVAAAIAIVLITIVAIIIIVNCCCKH